MSRAGCPADRPDLLLRAQHALRTQMSAEYTDQLHLQQQTERAQKEMVRSAETEVIGDAFSDAPKLSAQAVSVDKRFDTRSRGAAADAGVKAEACRAAAGGPGGIVDDDARIDARDRGGRFDRRPSHRRLQRQAVAAQRDALQFPLEAASRTFARPRASNSPRMSTSCCRRPRHRSPIQTRLMGKIDPSGDLQFGAFEEDVRRQVEAMKREKKSLAEISDFLRSNASATIPRCWSRIRRRCSRASGIWCVAQPPTHAAARHCSSPAGPAEHASRRVAAAAG